ncbi:MFS transporter [Neobacillus kokaensis]|uniref:MFS-type transporter YbfB n=1 Tax=Neobacillus kokaensis TaxID=2759023 RepID=A0ABQ3NCH9_9BACI|nr:MFS transporter [Neobacillus kokaensis]GHI01615.1 putative MFS-type transporter YbfB [Neobacillus kokaensis]
MFKKIHYGWVILAVCFIGVLAAQGLRYCFGAFMEPWEQEFTASRGAVSAISFVSFIIFALSQPVIGKLIDKYGVKQIFVYSIILLGVTTILTFFAQNIWQLLILYGVISSLGFGGASGVTASIAVTKWFHKKQGLALGLVEAGFGAGQMIMVSSSLFLISAFGWKNTVLILGGFLLLIIFPLLAIFLKSEPADMGINALGAANAEEKQVSKGVQETLPVSKQRYLFHRGFWFLVIPYFICGFTTTGLMDTHLIPFAQACGFSVAVTGTAVSLLAAFNTGGTIVAGIMADRFDNRKMVAWIYFLRGLTIVFLLIFLTNTRWFGFFVENPWLLFVFSISFGIVDFAVVAPTVKLLAGYFHGSSLGIVTGFLYMSHQLGSAIGSFLPGIFFDRAGSYTSSLVMAAILLVVASFVSACLPKQTGQQEVKAA